MVVAVLMVMGLIVCVRLMPLLSGDWCLHANSFSCSGVLLLEIAANNTDDVLGGPFLRRSGFVSRVENVEANMTLDDLGHEPIHGASAGCQCEQDRRAVLS